MTRSFWRVCALFVPGLVPALVVTLALGHVPQAFAQAWPSKPMTWIVPFPPGGVTDTTSRAVAKRMSDVLGQTFVIENRPGVAGSLATEQVARMAPDGYTVLYTSTGPMAANLALYKNLKYDPLKDFVPVHGMLQSPTVLVVDASKPYKTLAEFVAYAKSNPGKLNMGSAGSGTGTHLAGELFQTQSGTKFVHVPYKGTAPALQDMLGGRLDVMFDYAVVLLPHIKSGKLRALAIMGPKRFDAFPDVPNIVEAGYPGAEATSWSGIVVPAGTPADIVQKLSAAMRTALLDKEVVAPFTSVGSTPMVDMDEPAFRKFIADEQKKWADVVVKSGATAN